MKKKKQTPKPTPINPHVLDMLKITPPWWSRWLGDFRAWNRARKRRRAVRRQVHHIATITLWGLNHHPLKNGVEKKIATSWIHLYQRGSRRWYKYNQGKLITNYKTWRIFQEQIIPWTHFKFDHADMSNLEKYTSRVPEVYKKYLNNG